MTTSFLLYGANGYVGEAASQLAVAQGLRPILAGRDPAKLEPLAGKLGVEFRACALDDASALDRALRDVPVVLHCAGPYKFKGRSAVSRLHGPEAGLVWTTRAALAAVRRVLAGDVALGYQTPGSAFGPDFVLECEGVEREDVG